MKKFVSRREILGLIAKAGASGAVLQASNALGIVPDSYVDIPKIPRVDSGNRQSVVVLGAGVGGLTAALELKKAGYSVVVLEAAGRAGGRNMLRPPARPAASKTTTLYPAFLSSNAAVKPPTPAPNTTTLWRLPESTRGILGMST